MFVFTDVFEVYMYVHMYANNAVSVTSLKDVMFEFLDLLIALRNMLQILVIKKIRPKSKSYTVSACSCSFQPATLLKKRLLYLHVIAINFQMLWNNCGITVILLLISLSIDETIFLAFCYLLVSNNVCFPVRKQTFLYFQYADDCDAFC